MSCSRIFYLNVNVIIAGAGLENVGLCSALRTFKQGKIFIVPHLLWHGTLVFPVSSVTTSEGQPHSVAFTTRERMWGVYSYPDPQWAILTWSQYLHAHVTYMILPLYSNVTHMILVWYIHDTYRHIVWYLYMYAIYMAFISYLHDITCNMYLIWC
jgi:hypothetical protein